MLAGWTSLEQSQPALGTASNQQVPGQNGLGTIGQLFQDKSFVCHGPGAEYSRHERRAIGTHAGNIMESNRGGSPLIVPSSTTAMLRTGLVSRAPPLRIAVDRMPRRCE